MRLSNYTLLVFRNWRTACTNFHLCSKQHSRANTIFNSFFMTLAKGIHISGEECDLPDATLCGGAKRGSLQHSCYEQHVINHKALIASVVNLAEIFHSKTTSQADNSPTNYRPQKFIKNMMRLMCIKALAPDNFLFNS